MSRSSSRRSLPLYNDVRHGRNAYVNDVMFEELVKFSTRSWRFHAMTTSLQMTGGGIIKRWSRFPEAAGSEETFLTFIERCAEAEVFMPSSFGDVFHQRWRSPRVYHSQNESFARLVVGGWEEAKFKGVHQTPLRRYDLNRAYLWSLSRGLPDPRTYRPSRVIDSALHGLYAVSLAAPMPGAPYPFNVPRSCYLAGSWEIDAYALPVSEVHAGMTWERDLDTLRMVDLIESLPYSKAVARAFWGRWASAVPVECVTKTRSWQLMNPVLHACWAHWIVSGVKLKMWEPSKAALHVFVDSIITTEQLDTGDKAGEWREDASFPKGLEIYGPGIYREPNADRWLKHAGHIPADRRLR